MFVLGIDGGGSKTQCELCTKDGHVLGSGVSGGSNPNVYSYTEIFNNLHETIFQACKGKLPLNTKIVAGISGCLENKNKKIITDIIQNIFLNYHKDIQTFKLNLTILADFQILINPMISHLSMIIISGTGAIGILSKNLNVIDRVGGMGYLVDIGSGYALGMRAIEYLFECSDNTDDIMFCKTMKRKIGYRSITELHSIVSKMNVNEISSLAKDISYLSDNQNKTANKILKKISNDLISLIQQLLQNHQSDKIQDVILCGKIITEINFVRETILEYLNNNYSFNKMIRLIQNPAHEAILNTLKTLDNNQM